MILNLKQMVEHNHKLMDTFVDLKVEGWKTYSKALDNYTFSFYTDQLKEMDKSVAKMADEMKTMYRMPKGVC